MKPLIPVAEYLAEHPPWDIYDAVTEWYATDLENRGLDGSDFHKAWEKQNKAVGPDAALYSVGASCDMTAMCVLMLAAGVKRIEAMKKGIREAIAGNKKGELFKDANSGDHAHYFTREKADVTAFTKLLEAWCNLKGSGVIQFKFSTGDAHTFALERVQEKDKAPVFFVYQAYQNLYRLADFLGVGNVDVQKAHNEAVWDYTNKKKKVTPASIQLKNAFVTGCLNRIRTTVEQVGGKQGFDLVQIEAKVLKRLTTMLAGALNTPEYAQLTGCGSTEDSVSAQYMAVLVCDQVSPDSFKDNYEDLRKYPKNVTMYPEFYYPSPEELAQK
jgi:hypothetical protein